MDERAFDDTRNDGHPNGGGFKCVTIIDTNHAQTNADIRDIGSQHNRHAVRHKPGELPARDNADSCNQ